MAINRRVCGLIPSISYPHVKELSKTTEPQIPADGTAGPQLWCHWCVRMGEWDPLWSTLSCSGRKSPCKCRAFTTMPCISSYHNYHFILSQKKSLAVIVLWGFLTTLWYDFQVGNCEGAFHPSQVTFKGKERIPRQTLLWWLMTHLIQLLD